MAGLVSDIHDLTRRLLCSCTQSSATEIQGLRTNVEDLEASLNGLKAEEERLREASLLADAAPLKAEDDVAKVNCRCQLSESRHTLIN